MTVNASPVPILAGARGRAADRGRLRGRRRRARPRRARARRAAVRLHDRRPASRLHHVLCQTLVRARRRRPRAGQRRDAAAHDRRAARAANPSDGRRRRELARDLARRAGAERLRDIGVDEGTLEDCVEAAAQRPQLKLTPPAGRRGRDPRALPGRLVTPRPPHRPHGQGRGPLRLRRGAPRRVARRGAVASAPARSTTSRRRGRGHRRPRPGRRRLGLRGDARRDAAGAEAALAAALAIAEAQPAGPATPLAPVAPGARALVLALRDRPVRRLARGQARAAVRRRGGAARRRRRRADRPQPGGAARVARAQGVRLDRGRGVHAGARRERRRDRRVGRRTAASCRSARTRSPTAASSPPPAGSTCSRSTSPAHAPRVAAEAIELLTAPACPEGVTHDRPRRRAARAADPRVDRPRARARPHPARRGLLRRDELGQRRATSGRLRYGSEHLNDHRRRDAARRRSAPSAGTTRASRRAATRSSTAACCAPRSRNRESAAAIGLDRSGGCARADGFARQPIVRMTNVSIEPGDAGQPRGPHRRHRRGPLPRDEPLVVDRRPPPAVPVRAPRSAARSAAASSAGCTATRPTPGSRRASGARSTPSAAPRSGAPGG